MKTDVQEVDWKEAGPTLSPRAASLPSPRLGSLNFGLRCRLWQLMVLVCISFFTHQLAADLVPGTNYPSGFGPMVRWTPGSGLCLPNQPLEVGDFNGDGLDDLVCFWKGTYPQPDARFGDVMVALSSGNGFLPAQRWHDFYSGTPQEISLVGDFNGDGRDDILNLNPPFHTAAVNLSSGTGFPTGSIWHNNIFTAGQYPVVGDFNGDGRDDLAVLVRGASGDTWVALSTGTSFQNLVLWRSGFCQGSAVPVAGDFNNDGRDDLACFVQATATGTNRGNVFVTPSLGNRFGTITEWASGFAVSEGSTPKVTDINGDGFDDIIDVRGDGLVLGLLNAGNRFVAPVEDSFLGIWTRHPKARKNAGEIAVVGRFNRDLNGDLAIATLNLRPEESPGLVYVGLGGGHAVAEPASRLADFGYGTMGGGTPTAPAARGTRPLIVFRITYDSHGPLDLDGDGVNETPAGPDLPWVRTQAEYDAMYFGPSHPNIISYFSEMSGGQLSLVRAGPGIFNLRFPTELAGDSWQEIAQRAADTGFNFRLYDVNRNNIIEESELAVASVATVPVANWYGWGQNVGGGFNITMPDGSSLQINSQRAGSGDNGAFDMYAHEMAHSLGAIDLYSHACYVSGVSLMHCNGLSAPSRLVHLDPWHKMRLGWTAPQLFDFRWPGLAWIRVAQEGASGTRNPVLLFDGGRSAYAREFFMFEHRRPDYDEGTRTWSASQSGGTLRVPPPPSGGYTRGGYDINAAGSGLLRWYVGTEADNSLSGDFVGIIPGGDNVLQSVVAGDDTRTGNQILWGPNGVLNTVRAGDDGFLHDVRLFPASDPRDLNDREQVDFWPSDQSFPGPMRWMSGLDSLLEVRQVGTESDIGASGVDSVLIEFGKGFRPFLQPANRALRVIAGTTTDFNRVSSAGNFGTDRFHGWLVGARGRFNLGRPASAGSFTQRTFTIPPMVPPGMYRLFMGSPSNTLGRVSNSVEVDVKNPLYAWRISSGVSDLTTYETDADGDGRNLLLEAVQGTNPMIHDRAPFGGGVTVRRIVTPRLFPLPPLVRSEITWRYRAFDCIAVSCEMSTDLIHWTPVVPGGPAVVGPDGFSTRMGSIDGNLRTLFARLVVNYQLP